MNAVRVLGLVFSFLTALLGAPTSAQSEPGSEPRLYDSAESAPNDLEFQTCTPTTDVDWETQGNGIGRTNATAASISNLCGLVTAWSVELPASGERGFRLRGPGGEDTSFSWSLMAEYNALNAAAALAAAHHAGVNPEQARAAVESFRSVKRRMEELARLDGITVYDDFAHHPTAVRQTLSALRDRGDPGRVVCILEPRSNTMRMGLQKDALREALSLADLALVYQSPEMQWDARELETGSIVVLADTGQIIEHVYQNRRPGDRIVIMSNGGFEDLARRLVQRLGK